VFDARRSASLHVGPHRGGVVGLPGTPKEDSMASASADWRSDLGPGHRQGGARAYRGHEARVWMVAGRPDGRRLGFRRRRRKRFTIWEAGRGPTKQA